MISPSNDPSSDFTIRVPGSAGAEEPDVALAEGVPVPACWCEAQPNNKETKTPVGNSIFVRISFSLAGPAVNAADRASIACTRLQMGGSRPLRGHEPGA